MKNFKALALTTLALATTAIATPAFAYDAAAGREFDRQYDAAAVALDRNDFDAFCQHEANQKALIPLVRFEGDDTGAWNRQIKQMNKNLRICAETGRPTVANINIAQYNTPAPQVTLPANYCAGGSFGMSAPALCSGNGYTPERAKATEICKAQNFNGVRQVGNGWQCTSHRSNYTVNGSVFTF